MGALIFAGVTLLLPTAAPSDYQFVADTSKYVAIVRGVKVSFGKLDARGNFHPGSDWIDLRANGLLSAGIPPAYMINDRGPAYEFRSGTLIRGRLIESGDFVPDVGARVMDFRDYRYDPAGPRIYNLPGRFVLRQKKGDGTAKKGHGR